MRSGILLVEDDEEDQSIFCDAMASVNNSEFVHTEKNGIDAYNYLATLEPQNLPCLVLIDLNMPKMNGIELLAKVKENDQLNHLPVVIYTTSVNEKERAVCLRLGAMDYISKPLSYQQSINVAEMVVRWCRELRQ